MRKLTADDITVKSSGQLAREAILEYKNVDKNDKVRYTSRALDEFAEEVQLYPNSLKTYLRSRKQYIGSDTFRKRLTETLKRGYDEIVLSEEQQIARLADEITENIREYNSLEDIEVLERLLDLCLGKKLTVPTAKTYRAIALYNFYRNFNNSGASSELMKVAIAMLEGRNEEKLTIAFMSELALIYYYDIKYEKALSIVADIEERLDRIKDVDKQIYFLHLYRTGILYNSIGRHIEARGKFEEAAAAAEDRTNLGNALMNIGISIANTGTCYDEAFKYYNKALETFDPDDIVSQSTVFNNMAELYKLKRDYDSAQRYINIALAYIGDNNLSKLLIFSQTNVQINYYRGEPNKAVGQLIDLILRVEDFFAYKKYIIEGINTVIKYGDKRDKDVLRQSLMNLIHKNVNNDEYLVELKALLWDLDVQLEGAC